VRNLYSVGKITVGDSVPAFWVKLGTNDVNCVDVPLNPTRPLIRTLTKMRRRM